ncbi:hypothetical protein ACFGVR_18220 [Mucilaginibacter sp. AW1-3]
MKKYLLYLTLLLAVVFMFNRCSNSSKKGVASGFNISLSDTIPSDLHAAASDSDLAAFAWNEFLALNWKSSYSKDSLRDHPDTTWNYGSDTTAAYPDHVVWETYAHRSEFRPYSDSIQNFNKQPHYSYGISLARLNNASYTLFDNLDEASEIGSCNLFAHTNQYQKQYQVLYQAKVNKVEYNYVAANFKTAAALQNANKLAAANDSLISTDPCNMQKVNGAVCLPCGTLGTKMEGAVEVKTAWRQLLPGEDSSRFFMRNVIVYKGGGNGKAYYENKKYALIGLHIIHKTKNYPAFIFATFEHVNVVADSMSYQVLQPVPSKNLVPAKRLHPITAIADSATAYAHRLIKQKNPKSIWKYYRLVGVQGTPVNYTNAGNDPNFFLANFVVETDSTLANFNGSSIKYPHDHNPNLFYKGVPLSMGGCQGCHGVAQRFGGNSSFLMITPKVGNPEYPADTSGAKFRKLVMMTHDLMIKNKKH